MDDISMCGWCSRYTNWLLVNYWAPVWRWITTTWTACTVAPCNWWCLCCNKWLCWIFLIVLTILSAVLYVVLVITIGLVCIACYILCAFACALPSILGEGKGCIQLCNGPNIQGGSGGASGSSGSGLLDAPPGTGTGTGTTVGGGTPTAAARTGRLSISGSEACGCREGMIGMGVALLVFGALYSAGTLSDVATSVSRLAGLGVLFVLSGGLVGKTVGLLRA